MKDNKNPLALVLAKKLAGNDKKTRDKALRKLQKWLSAKSQSSKGVGSVDMMKIWKGLFYCMWMADKPLVQEDVAQKIADLIHCFAKTDCSLEFFHCGLDTFSREWNGIDRLRLDKFMLLVRRLLRSCLLFLMKNDWPAELVSKVTTILEKTVANPTDPTIPRGLKYHFASLYCEELAKVSSGRLAHQRLMQFLDPYVSVLLKSEDLMLCNAVKDNVFIFFLKQFNVHKDSEDPKLLENSEKSKKKSKKEKHKKKKKSSKDERHRSRSQEEGSDDDDMNNYEASSSLDARTGKTDIEIPKLRLDFLNFADELFMKAKAPIVKTTNRSQAYQLVQSFRKGWEKLQV